VMRWSGERLVRVVGIDQGPGTGCGEAVRPSTTADAQGATSGDPVLAHPRRTKHGVCSRLHLRLGYARTTLPHSTLSRSRECETPAWLGCRDAWKAAATRMSSRGRTVSHRASRRDEHRADRVGVRSDERAAGPLTERVQQASRERLADGPRP
jgi:hypothetical protein